MENIIEIKNLIKKFRHKKAVNGLSLDIKRGEIYGILGNNGAGKTTLLKIITGLTAPTSGSVVFSKKNIRTGTLISKPYLYGNMSAADNLKALAIAAGYKTDKSKIHEALETVGLFNVKKKVRSFSTGMKQRLGIALALLNEPDLLVLDEPTNGLDLQGIVDVRKIILDINANKKTTVLISSHNLDELMKVTTKICFISEGDLVFDGSMSEFLAVSGGSAEESYIKIMNGSLKA